MNSLAGEKEHYKTHYERTLIMAKKIVVETKIKSCNVKSNGESLSFEGISLTEDERQKVIEWIKEGTVGRLSFEPIQGELI